MMNGKTWSRAEIQILYDHKGESFSELHKLLPERTIRAIENKTRELRIKRNYKGFNKIIAYNRDGAAHKINRQGITDTTLFLISIYHFEGLSDKYIGRFLGLQAECVRRILRLLKDNGMYERHLEIFKANNPWKYAECERNKLLPIRQY